MIDFNFHESAQTKGTEKPFHESILDDSMKAAKAIGADADNIKKVWNDAEAGVMDKAGVINDEVLGNARKVTDSIDRATKAHRVDNRSIIARARNSVLQFPMYVSQSTRVNAAHTINKMFERVYTTLVQTVLSQNQIIDEEEANDLVFLKNFHTNLKEGAEVLMNKYYQPIDDIDQMMMESVFYTQKITENCTVEFRVVPTDNQDLILENARLLNDPLTGFMYLREADHNLNNIDQSKTSEARYTTLSEDDLRELAKDRAGLTDRERELVDKSARDIEAEVGVYQHAGRDMSDEERKKVNAAVNKKLGEQAVADKKLQEALKSLKDDIKAGKIKNYDHDGVRYRRFDQTGKTVERQMNPVDAPKLLKDSDIKKINGLLPYTIECTFRLRTKEGLDRDVHYIVGIKTVMHLIRTQDLAEDLRDLVTGDIKSLRKVRYKTGEIGFLDYLFNIKGLKADAAKHINYNKRWMNTLKRLAEYKNTNASFLKQPVKALTGGSVPIPNGTLVLTQPDVTSLTNQTGIDLSVVSNAKRLAKSLFLIGIVIVDSSAGTMRVLFPDSDNDWDVQSLASIDAELAKTDNSQLMKELNRMVNR
ncbi:MAG: hypothetical protein NC489_24335 [Ruminococcus flavefaciens]|nr:hypothetical protein [Ruminococcus flavefaciens]